MSNTHTDANAIAAALLPLVQEGLRSLAAPSGPNAVHADDKLKAAMADLRGTSRPNPHWVKFVPCRSPISKATFTAQIEGVKDDVVSGVVGDPEGFVQSILDYQEHEGVHKHVKDGGLVSDGMTMFEGAENGVLRETDTYRQWRYERGYKADARAFMGEDPSAKKRLTPGWAIEEQERAVQAAAIDAEKDAKIAELETKLAALSTHEPTDPKAKRAG